MKYLCEMPVSSVFSLNVIVIVFDFASNANTSDDTRHNLAGICRQYSVLEIFLLIFHPCENCRLPPTTTYTQYEPGDHIDMAFASKLNQKPQQNFIKNIFRIKVLFQRVDKHIII